MSNLEKLPLWRVTVRASAWKKGEFVDDMFGRLQILLTRLEVLGHPFTKSHINMKILDNFPKVWEPKTTTIQ